jgi:hypothetical protein
MKATVFGLDSRLLRYNQISIKDFFQFLASSAGFRVQEARIQPSGCRQDPWKTFERWTPLESIVQRSRVFVALQR